MTMASPTAASAAATVMTKNTMIWPSADPSARPNATNVRFTAFNMIWSLVALNLDQILIGKLFGATPLGLYRQGINLVLAPISQLSFPVNTVAEATLSRLQEAADRYRRYYLRFLGTLASVTMPLAVFLVVFAEEVVQVALGTKWVGAGDYLTMANYGMSAGLTAWLLPKQSRDVSLRRPCFLTDTLGIP